LAIVSDMNFGDLLSRRPLALAPMAGVSDRPFRMLCRRLGADYAVSEMITSQTSLWSSRKTRTRLNMHAERGPLIIQIAGADPHAMADAAQRAAAHGADVIDINMGCPAKKVCKQLAGSALLRDEPLVAAILSAVVNAVDIPVTLKTRTGSTTTERNGVAIGRLAENCGISALTMHGRTRACAFRGTAEYDTIAAVKQSLNIPVVANGDITSASEALAVLDYTAADGLMIGRAAHGNPWLFGEIKAALAGRAWHAPTWRERVAVMREHLEGLHEHYGCAAGVRIARKHIGWYLDGLSDGRAYKARFNRLEDTVTQHRFLDSLDCDMTLKAAA